MPERFRFPAVTRARELFQAWDVLPVGTPLPPTSATVAVKLTAVPKVAELGAAPKVVVVGVCTMILATKPSELPPP